MCATHENISSDGQWQGCAKPTVSNQLMEMIGDRSEDELPRTPSKRKRINNCVCVQLYRGVQSSEMTSETIET